MTVAELIESAEAIFERAAMEGQPRYKCVRAGIQALEAAGRLLPSGGEVSTQTVWPRFGQSTAGTRQVITWPDGSYYMGPVVPDPPMSPEAIQAVRDQLDQLRAITSWSPVVSDNSEKTAQWAIRDADGNTGDYVNDEREIRRSWAQGITWWDPDGTYELCRRDGATAPWEVVERHPRATTTDTTNPTPKETP